MDSLGEKHSRQKEQKGQRPHAGGQEVGEGHEVREASWGPSALSAMVCFLQAPGRVFSRETVCSSPVPPHRSSVPRPKQHGEWTERAPERPQAGLQPPVADARTSRWPGCPRGPRARVLVLPGGRRAAALLPGLWCQGEGLCHPRGPGGESKSLAHALNPFSVAS